MQAGCGRVHVARAGWTQAAEPSGSVRPRAGSSHATGASAGTGREGASSSPWCASDPSPSPGRSR